MENVSYFIPPAIEGYGKRRIFHALDHLNNIKYDKTAQQQRRACRFPRAGRVFSATQTSFYCISQSQITHLETRIKTPALYLAGDRRGGARGPPPEQTNLACEFTAMKAKNTSGQIYTGTFIFDGKFLNKITHFARARSARAKRARCAEQKKHKQMKRRLAHTQIYIYIYIYVYIHVCEYT